MKKIKVALLIIACCSIFSACGSSGSSTPAAASQPSVSSPSVSVQSSSEDSKRKDDLEKASNYIIDAKTALSASLGEDNCSVKKVYDYIMIEMWMDGVAVNVAKASEGDEACLSAWETTKESIQGMAQTYFENLASYGLNDWHVTVSVLNDLDHSKALLTYTDGDLSFDCLAPAAEE